MLYIFIFNVLLSGLIKGGVYVIFFFDHFFKITWNPIPNPLTEAMK